MGDRVGECGDNPNNGTFASHNLLGCPLDYVTSDQMIKPSSLIGTWNYVNGTISGKMVYSDYGNFTLKIPSKTPFGDYILLGSWGSQDGGHNLLTLCYETQSCVNNPLIDVTTNQITFLDNGSHIIHLMKPSNQQETRPETGATTKLIGIDNGINPLGTWSVNQSKSAKITFDSFIKYAHSKWPYCCDVNIQKFSVYYTYHTNIGQGRKTFGGYWNSSIYGSSPAYLQGFPSSLDLCAYNIQDHGEYHNNVSSPLSVCVKMKVDVIDSNHLRLYIHFSQKISDLGSTR
jgi:hypothetical protein